MSEQEKSAAQQRIDNAVYGTPKIKPDEQRKYLGTFRERVCLTISVQELQEQDWTKALTAELDRGIGNLVFINGNLPLDVKKRYPNLVNSNNSTTEKTNDQHQSFFHHLFHRKDRG